MSARRWVSGGRAMRALLAALALASCDATGSLVRESDEPQLFLVLSTDTVSSGPAHTALLITTGTPLAARFRDAERFELRRLEDGAIFRWRSRPMLATVAPDFQGALLSGGGNFVLAESVSADGLRAASVTGGATYSLDVLTEGRHITGVLRVPASPATRIVEGGGTRRVVWPSGGGAALYRVVAETDRAYAPFQIDTTYTLRYDADSPPANPRVRVTAIDSTILRYISDSMVASAGLSGAYGVLAGTATAVIEVPRTRP